jgi:hypothetical protein
MSSGDDDARKREEALFDAFRVEGQNPSVILILALQVQTDLDLMVDLIRAQIPGGVGVGAPPQVNSGAVLPQIKLPPLQLPDFDGEDVNWPTFWVAFSHTIDSNLALPDAQKLTYLVGRLKGSARPLVDGFALTDANYDIVVKLLKGRFGDDVKRAEKLRSELFHLPKPTGHSVSLRGFSEKVDSICRQLEAMGTNLDNNPFVTVSIKENLPTDVKAQLFDKEMEDGRQWTTKEWRERLSWIVRLKEAVHEQ